MDVMAKLTSKGQLTLPKAVRDALELEAGDTVTFRLEEGRPTGRRAVLAKVPDFLSLAGTVPMPPEAREKPWDAVRREAWEAATRRRR